MRLANSPHPSFTCGSRHCFNLDYSADEAGGWITLVCSSVRHPSVRDENDVTIWLLNPALINLDDDLRQARLYDTRVAAFLSHRNPKSSKAEFCQKNPNFVVKFSQKSFLGDCNLF